MAITPLPTLDRTSTTFRANVDTFFGSQLPTFATEANALQADVNAKQAAALSSADTAYAAMVAADASKIAAAASAATALADKNLGVAARAGAEAALDSFDDRYLGAKAAAPTLDNDGAALITGALYWDTTIPGMRAYNGAAWVTIIGATAGAITNTPAGNIAATTVQAALNELDAEKAKSGANTDITSLSGLTTALSIAQGGTGATTANAAADALGAFRKGTLLGAVSQTAGVPTGAVIERGSNANGGYVRWADGTQICSFSQAAAGNINNATGSIFTTDVATWTFPAVFSATPSVSVGEAGGVGASWGSLGNVPTSPTATSFQIKNAVSYAVTPSASLIAVGRWF